MSIKMQVHDGEPMPLALRRFKKLISQVRPYSRRHAWLYFDVPRIHHKRGERQRFKYYKRREKAGTWFMRPKNASLTGPIWYFYL